MSPGFADEVIDYVDALLQDPSSLPGQGDGAAAPAPAGLLEDIRPGAPAGDPEAGTQPQPPDARPLRDEPGAQAEPTAQAGAEPASDAACAPASSGGPEAVAVAVAAPPPPTLAAMPDPAPLPMTPSAPVSAPGPAPERAQLPAPRPLAAASPAPLRAPAPAPPPAAVSYPAQDSRWLRVMVGGDSYALELLRVQEVVRVAPIVAMRGARPAVLGVMNLRGRIVPVFDLGLWLGAGHVDADEHSRIVVVERDDELIGVLVSAVEDVVTLGRDRIEPPLPGGPAGVILGVARVGAAPTVLFDAYALYG